MSNSFKKIKIAVLIAAIFLCKSSLCQLQPAKADSFFQFIKNNPSRAAVCISSNDSIISSLNQNKPMPLASTVKLLVAIEFAKQAAKKVVDENGYIALNELDKYYLPTTDGDAHPNWLEYEKSQQHIKADSIRLIDIARGMMMFSSNANTEFLIDLLGEDNVKNNIQLLGLQQHTAIFHLVSSLFIYQNPYHKKESVILKAIKNLTEEEYCKVAYGIHFHLKNDSAFKQKFRLNDLSLNMQKTWSDRLPASTAREYVRLASILNNRKYFDETTYGLIAEIIEFPMENPAFQKVFKRYGVKGGSTAFVLTHVLYFTTLSGKRMELALFFNYLSEKENSNLQNWLDPFEAQVIFDKQFREKIKF